MATTPTKDPAGLTSLLFVPGSMPQRFEKALSSEADMICIDLEDAVPADGKAAARAAAIAAIGPRVAIRTNPVTTRAGLADLLALANSPLPELVLVPMVQSAAEIAVVRGVLGPDAAIVPLIETPAGLAEATAIANAPGVVAMMFGGGDMSGELGVALAWEPLLWARGAFLMACAAGGVPAIDVPFIILDDEAGLAEEAQRAGMLGFQAKAAVHPAQIGAIHSALRPSAELVAEARASLAASEAAGGGAIRFKGRMLEAPILRRYARIVAAETSREERKNA